MWIDDIRYIFEKDFNEKKYWKMRKYVQNRHIEGGVLCAFCLILLRRIEAKKCCTTGLSLSDSCCWIEEPLVLPHGLNGIVLAPNVRIGKNVTIFQRVTIAKDDSSKTTIIEDDVVIGTGAVIMHNIHIGKGAKIGASAVVLEDVPDYATAVGIPAKIIIRD